MGYVFFLLSFSTFFSFGTILARMYQKRKKGNMLSPVRYIGCRKAVSGDVRRAFAKTTAKATTNVVARSGRCLFRKPISSNRIAVCRRAKLHNPTETGVRRKRSHRPTSEREKRTPRFRKPSVLSIYFGVLLKGSLGGCCRTSRKFFCACLLHPERENWSAKQGKLCKGIQHHQSMVVWRWYVLLPTFSYIRCAVFA